MKAEFQDALIGNWPASLDMFNRQEIARIHADHINRAANNYKELWALFMLANWARTYLAAAN